MGRRPKWGRPLDGVLLLNKASGVSSNTALQQAKRVFHAKRAGHTGTLDPLATGVLPICFGESTKFSQYLLDSDKKYSSTFCLGVSTETGDCDGALVAEQSAAHITRTMIEVLLSQFRGEIQQKPSIYSAIKYQGKPLYRWAREGLDIPEEARPIREITVYSYEITEFRAGNPAEVDVEVHCSKGTYIRSLAEDLGAALGVGAHVTRLHRRQAGPFHEDDCVGIAELENERGDQGPESLDYHLLSVDSPAQSLPAIEITSAMGSFFQAGNPVMSTEAYRFAKEGGMVRVCLEGGQFLGVGELIDGNIAPRRVVVTAS